MKQIFTVTGMSCAMCQAHVEKAVLILPGIEQAKVDLLQNRLTVQYDEKKVSAAQIMAAVQAAGYDAQLQKSVFSSQFFARQEALQLKRRFFLSLIGLLFLLYISMGRMLPMGYPRGLVSCFTLLLVCNFYLRYRYFY